MPDKVKEAMQLMVEAERRKRAVITESEGKRQSEVNVAEGIKQSTILRSEAHMTEAINRAKGEAQAILKVAEARAQSIDTISRALQQKVSRIHDPAPCFLPRTMSSILPPTAGGFGGENKTEGSNTTMSTSFALKFWSNKIIYVDIILSFTLTAN